MAKKKKGYLTPLVLLPLVEGPMIALDLEGFSVSSGTACSSGKLSEISLLKEMEYSEEHANCSLRVSLGPSTKKVILKPLFSHGNNYIQDIKEQDLSNDR